ncbi:iron-containing alcohol dehydrogenase [Vibrio rarus]|uniref:iron-containing alcohol dehydrogenase n=1 Tax=Vibrio rarus TaxID=413403 RepID=UPI0021C3D613|nr:iron-containing alcohol dehydrogenase [Vibrio rarus]
MQFNYSNPTQIYFGQQQIAAIAKAIPPHSNVLLVYGGGSIKNNGIYDQVAQALSDHQWQEFSGVESNPTVETLDKAVEIVKKDHITYLLAVGGGSVIDGSKYIAAASCYAGDGWDILTGKHKVKKAVPLGAVLTLPATGSESNKAAVVTKKATKDKLSFLSAHVQPQFAVLDPDAMKTLPERQLINGLVDAWVHVCEQYITKPAQGMVQDGFAEALLKNLKQLGDNFSNHDDDAWRANLMWSANQALNGLIGTGVPQDWATHMIGHELTALYGVDHARSLTIIQPSLLRNQIEFKRAKLEQMGINVFGLQPTTDLAERTIAEIEGFYLSLGVATRFTEHGGDKTQVIADILAQLESHGMLVLGENQSITLQEMQLILESAIG